ncbi:MAG: glutamine-hydrolyzing GMP synthase [Gammaproteobacteria bacterium]|nr:glutamine-hydrolyzing GMP synthase [Gammaproteobacteria bacterium]
MIVVLDFGSQTTQLIARRVRELNVYCEIHPFDAEATLLDRLKPDAFILSGGPESVTERITPRIPNWVLASGKPLLGICYGMQAMVAQLGGRVAASQLREFGATDVLTNGGDALLHDLGDSLPVWMSHGDKVQALPEGFKGTAQTASAPFVGMADEKRKWYGIQFHPEVTHTRDGKEILRRFLDDVVACERSWNPANIVDQLIDDIRVKVGDSEVLLGLSGGVDSSVTAALLARAIGERLHCVFVDNGLLRLNERDEVVSAFRPSNTMHLDLRVVEARQRFLDDLAGVADPERKRKIIGETFIRVFEEAAEALPAVKFLAQGTIYPDVVESAATRFGKTHVIKSHHNVGGLPERLQLDLLEPLRDLFKDEVRQVGAALGLPDSLIYRHPFPGPGLAVRVLGDVREEYLQMLRQADAIFIDELRTASWYDRVAQAFCVFLPVKSVGVMGDARRYEYVIALRAVTTTDFMTADWAHLPHELLSTVSSRIINEVSGISRVVYDVSSKPPATIEWE